MNLQTRIREVALHIDHLQLTANKHKASGNKRGYQLTCEVLEENKKRMEILLKDEKTKNRIIYFRKYEKQHNQS